MKRQAGRSIPLLMVLAGLFSAVFCAGHAKNQFSRRLLRIGVNMCSKSNITENKGVMKRAAAAGYNGIVVGDAKLPIIKSINKSCLENLRSLTAEAEALQLAVIPMAFTQGAPARNDLYHCEALPVKNTRFRVSGNRATPWPDHTVDVVNGGFESGISGWAVGGKCGSWGGCRADGIVSSDAGKVGKSVCLTAPSGLYYLEQKLRLKRERAYKISLWVKTENFNQTRHVGVSVFAPSHGLYLLDRRNGGFGSGTRYVYPAKTQDWTKYTIDFNALNWTEDVKVWLRASKGKAEGKIWFDQFEIVEAGLYEAVRRPSLSISVKSDDGSKLFQENQDYVVADQALQIPSGSAIRDGDVLRVDWYQSGDVETVPAAASFCHSEVWDEVHTAAKMMSDVFSAPKAWYLCYSEWRVAFWDPACKAAYGNSVARYFGDVQKRTTDIIRCVAQNRNVVPYIYSDNYDPYHNASTSQYHLVNGSIYGSWDYMDPKTVIVNWNLHTNVVGSLLFFAGKDKNHSIKTPLRQVLLSNHGSPAWLDYLDKAEKAGLPDNAVVGILYLTWYQNYGQIESMADHCRNRGRWGSGPIPYDAVSRPASNDCSLAAGIEIGETAASGTKPGHPIARMNAFGNGSVRYRVARPCELHLTVFDVTGKRLTRCTRNHRRAGEYRFELAPRKLAKGVYLVKAEIGGSAQNANSVSIRKTLVY